MISVTEKTEKGKKEGNRGSSHDGTERNFSPGCETLGEKTIMKKSDSGIAKKNQSINRFMKKNDSGIATKNQSLIVFMKLLGLGNRSSQRKRFRNNDSGVIAIE